jgi:hypothetical protein
MTRRTALMLLASAVVACGWTGQGLNQSPSPGNVTPTPEPAQQPTSTSPAPTRTPPPANRIGVHLLLDDGRNIWPEAVWAAHVRAARAQIGPGGYVVQLVRDDDLDVRRWQALLDQCAELELRPILRLATTFDQTGGYWRAPEPDPDGGYDRIAERYADFVAGLHWPGHEHLVLVGNEPNHGDEWGGTADPAAYARFLRDVAAALHDADPEVVVLNAPLDPYSPHTNGLPFANGFTYIDAEAFMDGMQAEVPDIFTRIDSWASHPYPTGPLANGPWEQVYQIDRINGAESLLALKPPPGVFNRGINGYVWELAKLESYGVRGLEVWITETGWRHAETTDPDASDNGRDWPGVQIVRDWIDLALYGNGGRYRQWPESGWAPWLDDARVRAVVFFAFNGAPKEWGHTNWLRLDGEGAILGVYPLFAQGPEP